LSDAAAETETVPETVVPAVGLVTLVVGGVVSDAEETVSESVADPVPPEFVAEIVTL
jgi:hypothetical protein